jgi:thymidylate synthase
MATLIHGVTGRKAYADIVRRVILEGQVRYPRGLETRDMGNVTIHLESALDALPMGCGRGINQKIAAVEAIQLIGGFSSPALTTYASKNFEKFMERDGTFWGSYGTRVGDQVNYAVRKLTNDPQTRQAVVTLWDNQLDNIPLKRDYPCTVGFNFTLNMAKAELDMNVLMRSNDVWLGLPYDMFQFTQLQCTVARALGVTPGTYTHTTWSLHIYREHLEVASKLHDPIATEDSSYISPVGIGLKHTSFKSMMDRAQDITYGGVQNMTDSEKWYHEQITGWQS